MTKAEEEAVGATIEDVIMILFRDERMRRLAKAMWLRAGELMDIDAETEVQRMRRRRRGTAREGVLSA